jgi:hypothetical protein
MKKYFLAGIMAAIFIAGCVKDDQPQPTPPPPVDYSGITLNELITKDTANPYFIDESGSPADWVELYNKGTKTINVAGMWITDKPGIDSAYQQIPDVNPKATEIAPGGFLVIICGAADANGDDLPTQISNGVIYVSFGLSASKDNYVVLYDPAKTEVDRSGDFNGLEIDKSFGRTVDGTGAWDVMAVKTPDAPNNGGSGPVVGDLVINEVMVSNDTTLVPGVDDDYPDYIEIYNTGETPLDMGGWYVTDDLADSTQYQLPTDNPELTTVPPHGFLLLICDGTGEGLHTSFKLSSGGEAFGISEDGLTIKEGYTYCDAGCDLPVPPTDFSIGRDSDGAADWIIFDPATDRPPTPGARNNPEGQ